MVLHVWKENWKLDNLLTVRKDYRDRPRFFDQVGHQTTYAYIGNKHFFY